MGRKAEGPVAFPEAITGDGPAIGVAIRTSELSCLKMEVTCGLQAPLELSPSRARISFLTSVVPFAANDVRTSSVSATVFTGGGDGCDGTVARSASVTRFAAIRSTRGKTRPRTLSAGRDSDRTSPSSMDGGAWGGMS